MNGRFFNIDIFMGLLAGALLGFSWLFPGEPTGALLGWLSAFAFVFIFIDQARPLWNLYWGGVVSHTVAFFWLNETISRFGGFHPVSAFLIFSLFVAISALQFSLYGYLARYIDIDVKKYALTTPLAWCTVEFLLFRIFPWNFGHTQLGFLPFVQISDLAGSIIVTFLLFWVVEAIVRMLQGARSIHFALPIIFFALAISYGRFRISEFSSPEGLAQKVAVIQANVSIDDKHDAALVTTNVERYAEISKSIPGPDTLIIWPESVITEFINARVGSVGNDRRLPFFESYNPLLIGALTFEDETTIHNSALAILNSGSVLDPYHKQILMPFGEYMPLASIFPSLLSLNPNIAPFSAGTDIKVFEYPMVRTNGSFYTMTASPLICYEDIVPSLSRRATAEGAQLLVNLTNDAWFGDTVAPYQHNLIASFRAIENRRYLVRSTNTGLTAIISPTGETIHSLEPFSEGTLLADIHLMGYMSLYTQLVGDGFAWLIVALALTFAINNFASKKI